jgi:PAS domain S-box-containing protein
MSSIPANGQSRRRTARGTTTAALAWLRGNGVALTVLAGLLLIGSLALTQSGVAILAVARFGAAFNQVANTYLPNLLAASRLSELSQSLVARAPELAAAGSQTQRQGIVDRLNDRLAALARALDRIDRSAIDPGQLQDVRSQRDALATNLRALDDFVRQRIDADSAFATVMARLPVLAAHVRRVADEALIAGGDGEFRPESPAISTERPRLIEWSAASLEGITLMLGTPAVETKSRLERIRAEFDALVSRMDAVRSHLPAQMRQKIDAMHDIIVQFGLGDQSIFRARQAQIEASTAIQTSLRLVDQHIDKFLATVSAILGATQREIGGHSANLNQTVARFNLLIIVISTLCVLAGAAIFIYVRRAVITRLKRVQEYMRAQVEGRTAEMPTKGADEIAEIATATRVFVTRIANREAALHQRTVELSTALEQQTATAEVLQLINSSPGDLAPVFDTMLEKAMRLCSAAFGVLLTYDGARFHCAAMRGVPAPYARLMRENPPDFGPGTGPARILAGERVVHVLDAMDSDVYRSGERYRRALVDLSGARSLLVVPLLKGEAVCGIITIYRQEVRPFADKQIALLQDFAAQAVIAMENARLLGELRQRSADLARSVDELTATGDVLKIISRSSVDLETVLETLVETVARLCNADHAVLFRRRDDKYHLIAARGFSAEARQVVDDHPLAPARGTAAGRVALERRAVHIPDVLQDPEYTYTEDQKIIGYRTLLGIPLLREETLVGIFVVTRMRADPFTNKEIELVTTFADQAVIAIENARLFDELRERQAELRVTFDNMGDGVVMFDAGARLTAWNRNYQEMLDLSEDFLARRPSFAEYFRYLAARGEYLSADLEAQLSHAVEDPRRELRLERTRPDGRVIELRRNAVPGGGFVIIYSDITERKRAEAEIGAARDAAEAAYRDLKAAQANLIQAEKMASLGQLTAGIAHEIKNPLNFVNNFAILSVELLDELHDAIYCNLQAEIDELLETLKGNLAKIAEHGRRADSIVKNMLLHSRSGPSEHRLIDLNSVVEEALNLAYHGARAETPGFNITMEKQLDPAAGLVEIFPQEITRVMLNLISNGFYAARKRANMSVDAGFEPTLLLATRNLGNQVEIRVRDNGTGISDEVRGKIFEPFFTTKPPGEGTGLGLSLSYDIIVKLHRGQLTVDSRPNEFTEFQLILPRKFVADERANA